MGCVQKTSNNVFACHEVWFCVGEILSEVGYTINILHVIRCNNSCFLVFQTLVTRIIQQSMMTLLLEENKEEIGRPLHYNR